MTLVTIDLGDVAGGHDPDDHVVIRAEAFRESQGGGITSTAEVKIPLVDGVGQAEVEPGPVVVSFHCQAVADTREKRGVVPDEGPVDLGDVIAGDFEYTPAVVSATVQARNEARDAADRAEAVADSVYWQDDRLSVMGVLGPSLRGPKGDPGDGTGDGTGDVLWSELNPVLDGKAPVSHDHTIEQVSGLQDELDGKAAAGHQHSWGDVTGKPSAYPPESHTHPQSEVEGLEVALDGKASTDHTHTPASIGAAPESHTHPEYATTAQVEARTPEIRVVSSPELATSPGVLYVVRED